VILWAPSAAQRAESRMAEFMRAVQKRHRLPVADYDALYRYSVEHSADFWSLLWDELQVVASEKGSRIVANPAAMPGAAFFPDARLNFAENLLRFAADPMWRGAEALVARDERGRRRSLSFAALADEVARCAAALRRNGVGVGDRVVGMVPNTLEGVIAHLATASLGGVWSSCSPDFGVPGVLDRFGQLTPKVLIAADGYTYGGKRIDLRERLSAIADALPSLQRLLVFDHLGVGPPDHPLAQAWADALPAEVPPLHFLQVPFDHPLVVMFSSGTTGVPKAIVHGHGGTLLQQWKEHALHTDVRAGERMFYFTTCAWMMWNWLIAGLGLGATVVLYDGSPFTPQPAVLFDLASEERLAVFGTSAKYLSALAQAGVKPRLSHALQPLRAILSTGSPLSPEGFEGVYRDIKAEVLLASISGGTDIISCFALGCPLRPVRAGELQCRGLGMAVDVFDERGAPLATGKGELVCTQPFPSMPIGFWGDASGSAYRDAYFARYPGVWAHGDYAERTVSDGLVIHGRSDAVLNPGGVRIGTAEIYRVVERLPEVVEAICIGQPHAGDVRVVLFLRLHAGVVLDEGLRARVRAAVRLEASARHVPAVIAQVPDIPRTKSGKLVELAVRAVVQGEPVRNREVLANPEALEHFVDHPDLRG
jgi:acetoacetyl-CoA synthetase